MGHSIQVAEGRGGGLHGRYALTPWDTASELLTVPPPKQAVCRVFFHSSGAMWSRSLVCSCVFTQLDSPPDLLFLLGEWPFVTSMKQVT